MAVVLQTIHRALATTIKADLTRDTNVYPFPQADPTVPCVTVYPGDGTYIDYWNTFGPNGKADLMLRLKLEVDGDAESMAVKICDYLSVGTGNSSSIIDAVMGNKTLGGVVDNCVVLSAEWADPDTEPGVAWLPVAIILSKQNAEA